MTTAGEGAVGPDGSSESGSSAATAQTTSTGSGSAGGGASTDDWGADQWKAFAAEVGMTPDKVKERLGHARTWEQRAKDNATAAREKQSVEQQLAEIQQTLSERDARDVERNGRLALTQVRTKLAEAGIRGDDASGLLDMVSASALLADGEPDDKAITKLANSLTKIAGRAAPDADQGRKGGDSPPNMNDIIRRAAGITTN